MDITLESLADALGVISQEIASLRDDTTGVTEKVSRLEDEAVSRRSGDFVAPHVPGPEGARGDSSGSGGASGGSSHAESTHRGIPRPQDAPGPVQDQLNAAELQRDFEIIKDGLNRVRLPNTVKVFDNPRGIKKDCQPTLSVVTKCARYTETAVKQLSLILDDELGGRPASPDQLRSLFTILQAEINFLQCEYASLIVKSTFDAETATIFKCFEGNSGAFSERSMTNLHRAADITATASRGRPQAQSSNFRGRARGRGSGRGWYGNQSFGQRDVYHNLAGRNIPPRRGGPPGQSHDFHEDQ